ncbi:MAG TPA: M1 family aminopeptidase [Kofleriaceae bacterium]|nr:M1 family aminopeptidase [Kofleriaceae bacterium]
MRIAALGFSLLCLGLWASACSPPAAQRPPAPPAPPVAPPEPPPAAPASAALPDPPPPELRLPGDVRPTRYALELTIVPERERAMGRVAIDAQVVRPTRVVWLNATGLTIDRATLAGRPARVIAGGEDFIGLTSGAELPAGPLAIEIAFGAPIDRTKSRALYAEREGADWYAYTFFEPIDARRAFPCFDEPAYKVPWQLTFHVPEGHVALGNAPIAREVPEAAGMKRVELVPSRPLPSYLVAFVVGPFELVDGGTAGRAKTPIRFVIPKGRAAELRYAKQVTPRVVTALEDYFDMAYPFHKLDVAVVPRFWGTMEHPGIVAMGQPLTLIRPDEETRSRRQAYANILAHELAHYWFGDLVTMAWWDDTWLNEALGEWMDMIITEAVEPGFRHRDARVGIATSAMEADEALATQPVRLPVTTKEQIAASFDGEITYAKGASVLRMFEASLGPEVWRETIRAYLRAHEWGNAAADDLFAFVQKRHGAWTEAAMRSFVEQPGVPRIAAALECKAGAPAKLRLGQRRALPAGTTDPTPRLWKVPVCVRYGDGRRAHRACTQLDGAEGELLLEGSCPTWVIPNADATGYYRSVVDPAAARALLTRGSAAARAAQPTVSEKMMLLADLGAMALRDELALDRLLELVPIVAADPDELFARWAFYAASFRADALDDALYEQARRYYQRTFGPAARRLGWARGKDDSDERHDLRRTLVPMIADRDAPLAKEAAALAERWLAERKGLDADLVGSALYVYAARGDRARFDKLLAASKTARDRAEQQRILSAIGAFRDPALARQALELVRGTELDLRDSLGILYPVVFRRETRALGLEFVTANLDGLLARMRDDEASWFLGALAGGFCVAEQRALMERLLVPRAGKHSGAVAAVTRGLEQSQQCIDNARRQLPALRRFLARY